MTDGWRLLHHFDAEPGFNMAVDEELLDRGGPLPTLRFYTWAPEALSLGYFQRWRDVPAAEEVGVVVRRLTGGGAIHHARELTFSFAAPEEHPLYRGPVRASYERVHGAIAATLDRLGVDAGLRGEAKVRSDRAGTGMCFHESTDLDLCWGGRKGLGSAQRRRAGRVLHHGSIKLGVSRWEEGVSALEEVVEGLEVRELARELERDLAERFGMELVPGELGADEQARAVERANHFRSPEFLHRR